MPRSPDFGLTKTGLIKVYFRKDGSCLEFITHKPIMQKVRRDMNLSAAYGVLVWLKVLFPFFESWTSLFPSRYLFGLYSCFRTGCP